MKRKCKDCPAWTAAACRHAFGKYWLERSYGGVGCDRPVDDMAEAWRKAGWNPFAPEPRKRPCGASAAPEGKTLRPADANASKGRFCASGAIPAPTMPRRPQRPKVSAAIMRQAELFFGGRNG